MNWIEAHCQCALRTRVSSNVGLLTRVPCWNDLQKGERVTLSEVGLFSDGTAVKIVGEEPFRVCQRLLDGVVKVDTDELCAAIKDVFEGRL